MNIRPESLKQLSCNFVKWKVGSEKPNMRMTLVMLEVAFCIIYGTSKYYQKLFLRWSKVWRSV